VKPLIIRAVGIVKKEVTACWISFMALKMLLLTPDT
jgi:hypothetical protein